jgi:hypothetical protein
MAEQEPSCSLNLRGFPTELRKRLRMFAIEHGEELQVLIPRWLRERLEKESTRKPSSKPKSP